VKVIIISPGIPSLKKDYLFWFYKGLCEIKSCVTGNNIEAPTYPLALPVLQSIINQIDMNIEVELIDGNVQKINYNNLQDLVLISTDTVCYNKAIRIAKQIKVINKHIKIVIGGQHFKVSYLVQSERDKTINYLSREPLKWVDAVAFGYAENCMDNIITDFRNNKLKKVYDISGNSSIELLEPNRNGLFLNKYLYHSIETSRGCKSSCSFCSSAGTPEAYKKPKYVIQEITNIRKLEQYHGMQYLPLFFNDNALNFNPKDDNAANHYSDLIDKLIVYKNQNSCHDKLSFDGHAKPFSYDDAYGEYFNRLSKAGCQRLLVGFDTFESNITNRKSGSDVDKSELLYDHYRNFVNILRSNNLDIMASFMMIANGDYMNDGQKVIRFIEESNISIVSLSIMTPYPGSKLFCDYLNKCIYDNYKGINWDKFDSMCDIDNNGKFMSFFKNMLNEIYSENRIWNKVINKYNENRVINKFIGDIRSEVFILSSFQKSLDNFINRGAC